MRLLKTSRYPGIRDIEGKIFFKNSLGLINLFDMSIVFEISKYRSSTVFSFPCFPGCERNGPVCVN